MRALLALCLVLVAAPAPASAHASPGLVRVDQVGYATGESKTAYLLAPRPAPGARFSVVDERGRDVHTGRVGANAGAWSTAYTAVHPIDLSAVRTPGTYRVRVAGAESPKFRVDSPDKLFAPLVADTVNFFQVQRDGADVVPGELNRRPSHLTDRRATVYEPPVFAGDGGDVPAAPLQPRAGAGPVDVEGGWFDAGDFVKFTHASAYALTELLYVQRTTGGPASLRRETTHGLRWLDKMWDGRTLYVQVGIGTGSEEFGFLGDHDVWRLPEADDALQTGPGDAYQFIKYRPVFPAAPAGEPVSPNLAGRVSAAFALAAQLAAGRGDRGEARRWLTEAASVYAQARTTDVGELVTAFPHAYYPEDSWQDDMELGATQLALAATALGDPRADRWTREAAGWARAYLDTSPWDTLNLYDTSALAHADLVPLLHGSALADRLIADLRRQLDSGVEAAAGNPLGHAVDVTQFDAATRSFGYAATAQLYRRLTGSRAYDDFGTRQRNFAFGANAWGTSLMIGAGTTYPQCPQHQVANLSGLGVRGAPGMAIVRGAVVNGPNGAENFEFIGIPDGANACPADGVNRFAAYDRPDARYLDDVRAWPSSEPAIDFTSTAALALALS
ncbi:glycoside hydrolase family 9 protein [Phytohabitans rumicis]|uniref:Hydrolase n=1 Tax=Phytohabitans rumicis TaxID=1076125 RepID=A0A6V8LEL5_9ACTN|nr:glycoside hydrolase family 9 protein [Phytohabitans rumicis]GFJ93049.1 hydrolase [Phytohabitans rumicis]